MYHNYGSTHLKHRRLNSRIKLYIWISVISGFFIGLFYIVIFSNSFQISAFDLKNVSDKDKPYLLENLRKQVTATFLGGVLGPDNYLAWDKNFDYSDVRFAGIGISKDLSDKKIHITVNPRVRYAVWCNQQASGVDCYWVDKSGMVFEPAAIPDGPLIIRIDDKAENIFLGSQIVNSTWLSIIQQVINGLKPLGVPAKSYFVNRELQEFHVKTSLGMELVFSLRFNPAISALPAISRLSIKPGLDKIVYLDLTVENRAFIR